MRMKSQPLAQQIGELLRARGLTLAVAESCTGGLLGDLITDIPGSSDYFLGGVLSYSNQVKQGLLGVQAETLATQGAVSAQCAAEMAQGVRRLVQSDVALSVTGIAGPGGGSADKPTGLTYLHLSAPGCERGMRFVWPGDRRANKLDSALAALSLLLEYLHGTPQPLADVKEEEHG
jgi:PncC family amidohydrolase